MREQDVFKKFIMTRSRKVRTRLVTIFYLLQVRLRISASRDYFLHNEVLFFSIAAATNAKMSGKWSNRAVSSKAGYDTVMAITSNRWSLKMISLKNLY